MAIITGGEWAVRTLRHGGVDTVFALHGAHIDTLFQGCRTNGVRLIDVRHETTAGFAAEALARVTRRLGVAFVTAGPGFTNVVTSIANAFEDQTPVLYITGSAHLVEAETNALQAAIDPVAIARPITKWAHRIVLASQIGRLIAQAARVAMTPPYGPVLLDIPYDILTAAIEEDALPAAQPFAVAAMVPADPTALDDAAALLAAAERPVLMVGQGAFQAHGEAALVRLAEVLGAPVFVDSFAHSAFPADHPLYAATFYKMTELSDSAMRPDVILALGVRFGLTSATTSDVIVPHAASLIHVELDPRELGRIRRPDIAMLADPGLAADALADRLHGRPQPERSAWTSHVRAALNRRREALVTAAAGGKALHPYAAAAAVTAALPRNAIVVTDGAETSHWIDDTIRQTVPGSFLTHGFFGCMGIGLGMAIGAKAAAPDQPVVCISGDGSMGFALAEFDTMVRMALPAVVVVFNNHVWGSSTHYQLRHAGPEGVLGTRLGGARYDAVAIALGGHGVTVTRADEIGPAIAAALAADAPTCIVVEVAFSAPPPNFQAFGKR